MPYLLIAEQVQGGYSCLGVSARLPGEKSEALFARAEQGPKGKWRRCFSSIVRANPMSSLAQSVRGLAR